MKTEREKLIKAYLTGISGRDELDAALKERGMEPFEG